MHWAWQALGVHVSSFSEPMNAIILAQVGVEPKVAAGGGGKVGLGRGRYENPK